MRNIAIAVCIGNMLGALIGIYYDDIEIWIKVFLEKMNDKIQ